MRGTKSGTERQKHFFDLLWSHADSAYKDSPKWRREIYWFSGISPATAKYYMERFPQFMNPDEGHNDSPVMREMIALAEKYNGTIGGYAIPPESGRDDRRVTFDSLVLPIDEATAKALQTQLKADEFGTRGNGYRFWWD